MAQKERAYPAPATSPETKRFWESTRNDTLLIGKCRACGEFHYYPRTICPFCFKAETDLVPASGRGTIYSVSVMQRAEVPYAIGYVTLAEGPTMMTNFVECDFASLKIGQKVQVTFRDTEGGGAKLPVFKPA